MRVLDTWTGQFVEIDPKATVVAGSPNFEQKQAFQYAILSHTWDREGEQTYQELREIQERYPPPHNYDPSDLDPFDLDDPIPFSLQGKRARSIWADPELSPKICEACRVARKHGYRYLWIDSCCIDKTSSSELSESINSMYQWYALADVCYAFLPDVPAEEDHRQEESRFRCSRWFRRGWTLQELIAPHNVQFLSMEWKFIGSKEDLADVVVEITNIQHNALLNIEPLEEFSVAQRFSWAAGRETTRVEDRAYSLLGIFDINMPTLYGEGERAFRRLQEEIMRRTPDQSLFAWTQARASLADSTSAFNNLDYLSDAAVQFRKHSSPFLVPSVEHYERCTGVQALSHDEVARRLQLQPKDLPTRHYDFTPYGICVQLPVMSFSDYFPQEHMRDPIGIPLSQQYLAILGCEHKDFPECLLARICYIESSESNVEFLHCGYIHEIYYPDLLTLSPATIARLCSSGNKISIKTLCIPQPERYPGAHDIACWKYHGTIKLVLLEKTCKALSAQGYTATLRSPDDTHRRTHSATLSHDTHTITIYYQHTLKNVDILTYPTRILQELTVEAHVKTSGPVLQDTPGDPRVLRADGLQVPSVSWVDMWFSEGWTKELGVRDVELTDIPGIPTALRVRLGLTFAKTNHYVLRIELETADPIPAHAPVAEAEDAQDGRPGS